MAFKVPELGESPSSGTPTVLLKATKLPRRDSYRLNAEGSAGGGGGGGGGLGKHSSPPFPALKGLEAGSLTCPQAG